MEWLKKLLAKAGLDNQIVEQVLESAKDEQFIPKARFDEVNEQSKELKNQLADRDKQLKELSKKAEGNEDLQKQIEALQTQNQTTATEYEAKIRNIQIDNLINGKLAESKVKHADLLASKFNRDAIKFLEDGKVEGFDEQLKGLKETYADLFEQEAPGNDFKGGKPADNTKGGAGGQKDEVSSGFGNVFGY